MSGRRFLPCQRCGHGKTFHNRLGCRAFVRTGTDSNGYPTGGTCDCQRYMAPDGGA